MKGPTSGVVTVPRWLLTEFMEEADGEHWNRWPDAPNSKYLALKRQLKEVVDAS